MTPALPTRPLPRQHFEEEIREIRRKLLAMASAADEMLDMAMRALTEQDVRLAEDVIEADEEIDLLNLEIEGQCMTLIALQQPLAQDLRLIGTIFKVITDIERIADHAVDIAKAARKLARDSFFKPLVDLPRMAVAVRQMLRDAMAAFVNRDLALVHTVVVADDEVDRLFRRVREDLHMAMQRDGDIVVQGTYLLFVAHYLERIADHAVNIAERVHFVETGSLSRLARDLKAAA